MTQATKPTTGFWIIGVLSLLWNLSGVAAYLMQVTMTPETLQQLPAGQRSMYESVPLWATSAFAIAVWGSTLGSVLLLMKKQLARRVFMVSLAAILVQQFHAFVIANAIGVLGASSAILPACIPLVGIFLVWYSTMARDKGWLV